MKRYLISCILLMLSNIVFSTSYFKTVDGKRYFGDIKEETETYYLIVLGEEYRIIKLDKNSLILVEYEEKGLEIFHPELIKKVDPATATTPFYAKGNNLYIPMNSAKTQTRAGGYMLRKLMMASRENWNIVDTPQEAHYIVKYIFDDSGSDKGYIKVEDRNGKVVYTSKSVKARDFIPRDAGEESAEVLFNNLMKNIKKGKL